MAIRCTAPSCSCDCFSPCKSQIRTCDGCGHGWVSHALDKLGFRHLFNCHQVELVQPSIAFDVASLMLYGTQAIPVRLKILLDRLFSVLQHEEVLQVLHGFGWTYEDYARGYILQDPSGHVLDRWLLASREEEPLILQQFLRFGETRTIAQQLLLQDSGADAPLRPPRTESDIKKFIERTASTPRKGGGGELPKHGLNAYSGQIPLTAMPTLPLAGNRPAFRQPTSSVSSTHSVSPTVSSPVNHLCTSPNMLSPLNKLQNMQPYDYRHHQDHGNASPEPPAANSVPPSSSLLSLCSSTVNSSTFNNSSTYTTASSDPVSEDGVYCSDVDDDDEEESPSSAINLTRSSHGYMDSVFAAKKVRHLRKSANPMKRRWNPTVLATLSTNPATGKKRVQCHVCLKTFCDKGALKIHFSAVHLREMHKCTVDGCNMMFSSRRSRNRHSANPNPKLHTPNYRRKINPHDGRAANPYPLMPPSGMMDFNNGLMSSFSSGHPDGDSSSCSDVENVAVRAVSAPLDHHGRGENHIERLSRHDHDDAPLPLMKRCRTEELDELSDCGNEGIDLTMKEDRKTSSPAKEATHRRVPVESPGKPEREDGQDVKAKCEDLASLPNYAKSCAEQLTSDSREPSDLSVKSKEPKTSHRDGVLPKSETTDRHRLSSGDDVVVSSEKESRLVISSSRDEDVLLASNTKNVRKRKSLNPTKCPTTSDDDLQYVSTDDTSSDTYIDRDAEENGLLDSKSDFLSSDGSDSIDDLDDNPSDDDTERGKSDVARGTAATPPPVAVAEPKDGGEPRQFLHNHEKYNGFRITADLERFRNHHKNMDDVSENPLRHLESLTLGAFNTSTIHHHRHHHGGAAAVTASISSGVSYHAPGLGLASVTTTTAAPCRAASPPGVAECVPPLIRSGSLVASSHQAALSNNSDTENSMSDQQMPLLPVYRDASIVGSVEIPVDKENPRRCTACGKIFQNHFGVKTHYQNVHLKLMHKCTVEGCNAAFPSKRSRDRHSANLNLHRKLLSTSSSSDGGFKGAVYPMHYPETAAFRGEFFSRFYDPQSIPLSFAELYHSRLAGEAGGPFLAAPPFVPPGFHPAFLPHPVSPFKNSNDLAGRYLVENSGRNSSVSSISNASSPDPSPRGSSSPPRNRSSPSVKLEEDLVADSEGRYACTICEKKFHEGVVLREHYEKCHTQALLQCVADGCNKAFLSSKSRSVHSDSLHQDVASAGAAATT